MVEIQHLTFEGFIITTINMRRGFCVHVVDSESDYFVKDGLEEDLMEEVVIEYGSEDDSKEEDNLMDDDDNRLIDVAL